MDIDEALDPVEAMRQAPARIAHQFTKATEVWRRYVPWADVEDRAWRILDVEREYEATIDGRKITARLDLVVAAGGKVHIVDHKSASGDLAQTIRGYSSAGQMALEASIGATILPEMYSLPWGSLWINAISTSGAEPAALRAPLRVEENWRLAVIDSLGVLLRHAESVEEGRPDWPSEACAFDLPVSPESCWSRWGKCDYYDLCRQGIAGMRSSHFAFDRGGDQVSILREGSGR
jgi:hypothetical protein